jgi:hypothetical protein
MERSTTEEEGQGASKGVEEADGESRLEGDRCIQVATEELKDIELSILMESRSLSVFEEEVNKHPWCQKLYRLVNEYPCECGDNYCNLDCFQLLLEQAAGKDKGRAAAFIAEVHRGCGNAEDLRVLNQSWQMELYQSSIFTTPAARTTPLWDQLISKL